MNIYVRWGRLGRESGNKTYALASAAVAEELAVVALSDADLAPGDDGAGKRGTEEIALLEGGVAHDGLEDDILHQLTLQVLADEGLGAQLRDDKPTPG